MTPLDILNSLFPMGFLNGRIESGGMEKCIDRDGYIVHVNVHIPKLKASRTYNLFIGSIDIVGKEPFHIRELLRSKLGELERRVEDDICSRI